MDIKTFYDCNFNMFDMFYVCFEEHSKKKEEEYKNRVKFAETQFENMAQNLKLKNNTKIFLFFSF